MSKLSRLREHHWLGLVFIAAGGLMAWGTSGLPAAGSLGDAGPSLFPRVVAALTVLLGILLVFIAPHDEPVGVEISEAVTTAAQPITPSAADARVIENAAADVAPTEGRQSLGRFIAVIAASLAYAGALYLVGLVPATIGYLGVAFNLLNPRRLSLRAVTCSAVAATAMALAINFALTRWLGIIPP